METGTALEYKDADGVLRQGFKFRPRWWQRPAVPAPWAAFLDDLPADDKGRDYRLIARRDLLTGPGDRSPDEWGQLLLACYVWGTGDGGWLVGRRARVFRDTPHIELGRRLAAASETLREEGPVAAYTALLDGGRQRTKHLGPSFFTKFLYAADAPGDGSPGRALILDQFVARTLNHDHGWAIRTVSPWAPDTYRRWLDHAHEEADRASQRTGVPVRADAVEMAYFDRGKRI